MKRLILRVSALAVVRAIFEHDDFWAPERRYAKIKDPISWIVELQRRTGVVLSPSRLDQRCEQLNQQLLRPPSVAGWGHNGAWLSSAQLLTRNRVALDLARNATDTGLDPISVSVRTRLATLNECWNRRSRIELIELPPRA